MINKKIENQSNDSLFFTRSNLDNSKVDKIVSDALHKADDGELFMEFCESESFVYDDQRLKSASFDTSKGFGLRAIAGESSGYAHSSDIDENALKKASETVNFITKDIMQISTLIFQKPTENFIMRSIQLMKMNSQKK